MQFFVHVLLGQHKAGVRVDDAVRAGGRQGGASRRSPRHEHRAEHKQHRAKHGGQFFHLVFSIKLILPGRTAPAKHQIQYTTFCPG